MKLSIFENGIKFNYMRKKIFAYCLIFLMLYISNAFSQYNDKISSGIAPWLPVNTGYESNSVFTNQNSVGFSYYAAGTAGSQLFKYKVGSPAATTQIGAVKPYLFGSGDFANPTGVWKFYVLDQSPPYTIYEVDTATGNLTGMGILNNLKSGHKPTDMEWDHTTGFFYVISTDTALTETQMYKMYWPTKDLSWIGTSSMRPSAIIAGGFNANGTYFGIDLLSDSLWKVNKNTGVWTRIGALGYPVNYSQDAGFDRTDFSRMLWCACGSTVGLYEIDTATAGINLIGTFPSYTQVMATGFTGMGGPQITATQYPNTQNLAGPYVINAVVTPSGSGIASTKIFWSRNNPSVTDSVTMTNSGGNNWTGNISGNGSPATYRYYCITRDSLNRTAVAPIGAPSNLYTFIAMASDTSKPVITHTPIGSTMKTAWPINISASVTDNFGIDSVWVRWNINRGVNKLLKLPLFTGTIYQSLFNSVNADVVAGDTVFYRIIAQDNSSSHNRDSTPGYGFRIIGSDYNCIGSGITQVLGYPFNTLYYGNRTQMLWTKQELQSVGGVQGYITRIGFEVAQLDTNTMNNFSVKMQSISDTVIPAFLETNWTTVYSGTYKLTALGWQYIDLQTPFEWDANSSVVVQICFENTIKYFYSTVRCTFLSGVIKCIYDYKDMSNACTEFQTVHNGTYRPNICFKIVPLVNTDPNFTTLPKDFSLSQNYPNPFNPVTRIKYDISEKANVTLKIYDLLGREVGTLVNETKIPGTYSVDFNASNLPSGIYLCVLKANSFMQTKRMVLIK